MNVLNTSQLRRELSRFIHEVHDKDRSVVVGHRNRPRAILIKYPDAYNDRFSSVANMNAYSRAFDFLSEEPELYSREDVKKAYA